jgi:hypothetical protein
MTGSVPTWLLDRLGVTPGANSDAATWQLDTAWAWAPWATLLLVLAAIAWTVLLYAHESTSAGRPYRILLATLRLGALGLMLIMLAQWALALRLTGPPVVALVIDRSASMGILDRYHDSALVSTLRKRLNVIGLSEPTRLNLAKLLLVEHDGRLLRELSKRYQLSVYFAADGIERDRAIEGIDQLVREVRSLSSDGPDRGATRLGDAVRQVLDNSRTALPAAVILLSDGVTTKGVPLPDAAREARRMGVPLFTVGVGSDEPPRDIELADVLVDDAVFVDDLVSLQVELRATGLEGQPASLTLRRDGESTPLAEQTVTLPADGETFTTYLADRPTAAGEITYVIEVATRDDETDLKNNQQRRSVSVRDEKIRVLLAQGYPSYEFRFLKTLLERDRTVQLDAYLQEADPEFAAQDKSALPTFPISREELFEYDVLVIGDVDPRLLPRSTWENVRAFIRKKGGGVAFLAGPRYLPWLYRDNLDVGALLPVDLDALEGALGDELPDAVTGGFVVRPTPLGLRSPALQLGDTPVETAQIWQNLAPLYWMVEVAKLKPAAQVLAEHPTLTGPTGRNLPAICFQYVGPGRVWFQAIDSTWRWRLGAGDVHFARFWVQTIRFLARGKLTGGKGVQLVADRREYRHGETVELRARFLDPRLVPATNFVTVLLETAGQPRRRVRLRRNPGVTGVFEGSIADLAEGRYEVVMAEPQLPGSPPATRLNVVAPPGELARLDMDSAALAAAAETSRGRFYTMQDADRLLLELPVGRRVPLESLPSIPLWNRWWLLAAFLACITSEWILRRLKGML